MKKLILVPLIFLATACSTSVESKYHMPEYKRIHVECDEWSFDDCLVGEDVEITIPECWRLVIYNSAGWDRDMCVDKETWNNTYVGQEWE